MAKVSFSKKGERRSCYHLGEAQPGGRSEIHRMDELRRNAPSRLFGAKSRQARGRGPARTRKRRVSKIEPAGRWHLAICKPSGIRSALGKRVTLAQRQTVQSRLQADRSGLRRDLSAAASSAADCGTLLLVEGKAPTRPVDGGHRRRMPRASLGVTLPSWQLQRSSGSQPDGKIISAAFLPV